MTDECEKYSTLQVWHLLPREASLRAKDSFTVDRPRKVLVPLETPDLGIVFFKKQMTKGNGDKNIASVTC